MSKLPEPELILGFARAGSKLVVIAPDGSITSAFPGEVYEAIVKNFGDGPQVIKGTEETPEQEIKRSYGVLYNFARKFAVAEVGGDVVGAAENVLRRAHARTKHALRDAPAGSSAKWRLRNRNRKPVENG